MPLLLRFMSDDIKAFYLEAATAQPGRTPKVQGTSSSRRLRP